MLFSPTTAAIAELATISVNVEIGRRLRRAPAYGCGEDFCVAMAMAVSCQQCVIKTNHIRHGISNIVRYKLLTFIMTGGRLDILPSACSAPEHGNLHKHVRAEVRVRNRTLKSTAVNREFFRRTSRRSASTLSGNSRAIRESQVQLHLRACYVVGIAR